MASPGGLNLSLAKQFHVDGTFKSASEFYHQLWINLRMIHCAYVLMSQRRVKDYNALQALKNVARLLGLN